MITRFKNKRPSHGIPIIIAILSGLLYAISLKYFLFPAKIILTGTEGISSATSYYFEQDNLFIILYIAFQSILIAFAFFKVSRVFAFRTLITVISVAFFIPNLPEEHLITPDPDNERLLLVLFGGIIAGLAKVIALKNRGSTGDEDVINAFISERLRKSVGTVSVFAALVSTVYGLFLAYLKDYDFSQVVNTLMYTAIYIFVSAETLNDLFRKFRYSLVTIITADSASIEKLIRNILPERTHTRQEGEGGFSKNNMDVITILVTQDELPILLKAIKAHDAGTFVYHHEIDGINGRFIISSIG